ncbi:hypothetical protein D3C81_1284500 [compost metagenome]
MLAVGLREHHQFHVGRVAAELGVGVEQVVDLVLGQRETHRRVGLLQRGTAGGDVHEAQRLGRQFLEQPGGVLARGDHGFGHAVEQVRGHGGAHVGVQRLAAAQQALLADHGDLDATLDAVHVRQPAVMRDVRGLAGPWRDRAETRNHHEAVALGLGRERRAVGQQRGNARLVFGGERRVGVDKMQKLAMHRFNIGIDLFERGKQALLAEGGKRQSAGEAREMRHDRSGREA